jgi:protocatechuate 3,4-dioxygenase beta subunit
MMTSTHSFGASMLKSSLLVLLGLIVAAVVANGEEQLPLLVFNGRLLNDRGEPVNGAQVQFWQTDRHGNYDHPKSDRGGMPLESGFQYFGTATTVEDGSFQFRTRRPGIYPQRPITHIHYKIWYNGTEVLTSQFYFADEGYTQFSELLQLELVPSQDNKNNGTLVTNKTIVVDLGLDGTEPLTPSQQEGPFYPVFDFFNFDSDMTNVTAQEEGALNSEEEGTPTLTTTTTSPSNSPSAIIPATFNSPSPTSTTDPSSPTETPTISSASGGRREMPFVMMVLSFLWWMDGP